MEVANIWTNWETLGVGQWSMVLSAVLSRSLPLCLGVCVFLCLQFWSPTVLGIYQGQKIILVLPQMFNNTLPRLRIEALM